MSTRDFHPAEVYGRNVIAWETFPANDGTHVPSVTVDGAPAITGNICYWLITLPDVGEVWCATQLGPLGTHNIVSPDNPYWWRVPSGSWNCIHGDTVSEDGSRGRTGLCDGSCGKPNESPFPATQEDVDAAVAGLLSILRSSS